MRRVSPLSELTELPDPQYVMVDDGYRVATYSWGDDAEPVVVAVHGFASNARDNWVSTGWVRDLRRAGFRVLAVDQRGHGASDKPHDPHAYRIPALAGDVEAVLDTHLVDTAHYLGYSLGGRVGWQVARELPDRIERVVLGGVPDGVPLARLDLGEVRAYIDDGVPVTDPATASYIALTERVRGNDPRALLALATGLREAHAIESDPAQAPTQPTLFATGSEDANLDGSRALAAAAPQGRFVEIPGRHHFNAPGSRLFREAGIDFLSGY